MATLAQLRLRVYNILDDNGTGTTDGTRWALTEVDTALAVAVDIVAATYASMGGNKLDELVSVSLTDGAGDLSSYKPLVVKSVQISSGGCFYPIQQSSQGDALRVQSSYSTLRVRMVRSATFPTSSGDTVSYGSASGLPVFDELICGLAARMLLRKDREVIQGLETQAKELLGMIVQAENTVVASDFPGRRIQLPACYTLVGNTLQLVVPADYTAQQAVFVRGF